MASTQTKIMPSSATVTNVSVDKRSASWSTFSPAPTAILVARVTGANAVGLGGSVSDSDVATLIPADGKTYVYGPFALDDRPWFVFPAASTVIYTWHTVEGEAQ